MRCCFVVALAIALTFSACRPRHANVSVSDQAELLAEERGRLLELTDPVERTRSYITVSGILLDFAASFAHDGNTDGMKALLSQYDTAIQEAADSLIKSERDAEQNPEGFKDLEVALRLQIRLLNRLNRKIASRERQPVQTALRIASLAREQMLNRLSSKSRPTAAATDVPPKCVQPY